MEGQGALNALDMDCSSRGFDRARSRPAKIVKGAKKAAYYPEMRHSTQSLARRLASPLFMHGGAARQGRRCLRRG